MWMYVICKHFSVYHAFGTTTEGIYLRTRSDGRLFNVARLRSETKVRKVLIRDMLFADDAAVATPTHEDFSYWLTASHMPVRTSNGPSVLKQTNVVGQDTEAPTMNSTTVNSMLSAISTTSAPPSLTTAPWTQRSTRGLGRQLQLSLVSRLECGQAPSCLWRQRWRSIMPVFLARCCMSARHGLHYAGQERRINTLQLRSIPRILCISWQYNVTNAGVLYRAGLPSMYMMRRQRIRWW